MVSLLPNARCVKYVIPERTLELFVHRAGLREQLDERERAMAARGNDEVLAVGRAEDRVEALAAVARMEGKLRAVREHAVHRQAAAVEVVARRVEDDEVHAGRGDVAHRIT